MILLLLGLAVFAATHLWRRLAPEGRARLGDPGKGVDAVGSILGVWLMARGYGHWPDDPQVWTPAPWLHPVNNLMVAAAFYLFVSSGMRTWGARATRHPQLSAVILWAVAHLLVNGDAASILLFGGLLLWAVAEIALINRAAPAWDRPPPAPPAREAAAVVATLAALAAVGWLHGRIGPWPFWTP